MPPLQPRFDKLHFMRARQSGTKASDTGQRTEKKRKHGSHRIRVFGHATIIPVLCSCRNVRVELRVIHETATRSNLDVRQPRFMGRATPLRAAAPWHGERMASKNQRILLLHGGSDPFGGHGLRSCDRRTQCTVQDQLRQHAHGPRNGEKDRIVRKLRQSVVIE